MPSQPPVDGTGLPSPKADLIVCPLVVRRIHMYLGLFLGPWMLMYALSTLVMNHRDSVQSMYSTRMPAFVRECELDYSRTFAPDASREQIAREILNDLGLEGAHRVSGGKDGKPLVIERQQAFAPRRITWAPDKRKILVERQEFRVPSFLERMHRRRGYEQPYPLEDAWAFSVDLSAAAMVIWSLSGLWLWWGLKPTRFWGVVCGGLGLTTFVLFLVLV